jgi:hypothetical protein
MRYSTVNIIAIGLFTLLAGCTANNGELAQATVSLDHELIDVNGLTLKPSENMYLTPDAISESYLDTMSCTGLYATGPTVEFRSFSYAGLGSAWAFYHAATNTIWINTDEDNLHLRDSRTDTEALQHEFVHHILYMNGYGEDSHAHASTLFQDCGNGVDTYN